MTRPLTKPEAMELIEVWFNMDAVGAHQENGSFQLTLLGLSQNEVEDHITDFATDQNVPVDMSAISIQQDMIEEPRIDCVTVTIRTETRA